MLDASSASKVIYHQLHCVEERGDTTHCDQFEVEYVVVAGDDFKVQPV